MKNVLLINGSMPYLFSKGELNASLQEVAFKTLSKNGFNVEQTTINQGYDEATEVEKFLKADIIIYQIPCFYMNAPWIFWEYLAKVYTAGKGKLWENDGRSRSDPSKKYGSGGLSQGKKYMISWTFNAPKVAFFEEGQFFSDVGVDGLSVSLHKANQSAGMSALKTFACYDVHKGDDTQKYLKEYENHILNEIVKS